MNLLLATFILSISYCSFAKDYQELSWDMSKEDVAKLLPRDSKNSENWCEGHDSDMIQNSSTLDFLYNKVTPYLPNYHWAPSYAQKINFIHDNKYRRERYGEGCAMFYNEKFVGFRINFYTKSIDEILKIYEEKYGKFTKVSAGFLGKDFFYFESLRTMIILGFLSTKGDSPTGFYFSKISKERILSEQSKIQEKMKPSTEDKNRALKNKI
jgi:hypothetical protein